FLPDRPKVEAGNQQQQQQQQQTVVIPGAAQPGGQQTGTVIVSASVEGADIYVDGLFVGNAPANLKLSEGVHVIEVKKDGYETFKRELRVFAAGEVSLKAELKKP
ncbi:PEGA domain-containing protein, partial [bacterium]|nr:PEGA domain-containing protein [bacterium]